jgi:hypothetical protein
VSGDVRHLRGATGGIRHDFGLGAFMLYMLFIIGELAWSSKAGKLGTFVLFFVLSFGMLGFIAKFIIQKMWGI